jgi:hypothetical protein
MTESTPEKQPAEKVPSPPPVADDPELVEYFQRGKDSHEEKRDRKEQPRSNGL